MDLDSALDFVRARSLGVLTTIRRDGRPQLSNILYVTDDSGTIRISVTDSRAKTHNLRRDPRASLYVAGDTPWSYVVVDAVASLTEVASAPQDRVADELVDLYRRAQGEHPDWDDFRRAMVEDGRLVIHLEPERAYGILPG